MCSYFQGFLKENRTDQNDMHVLSSGRSEAGAAGDRVSVIEMGWRMEDGR